MVNALVKWFTYNVAGQALGTVNSEFNVNMDLNAAASNTVNINWVIRSVYIDNTGVNFPVFVFFPSTGFSISCPPNSSGWYQVFTFDRRAWICALGISDIDISNQATTNVFFTDGIVNSYLDQETPTAVNMKLSSPVIAFSGIGGQITQIKVIDPGQWTAGGAINISGGGGVSASAHGVRDNFGSFTGVIVDAPGNGFSGPPNVEYGGTFLAPPAWAPSTHYNAGQMVTSGSFVYAALVSGILPEPPPNGSSFWAYTGYTSTPRAPTMQATISTPQGGASFSNIGTYGPAALGDQVTAFIDQLAPASGSIFRSSIFGSSYQSGFIYLTHIDVRVLGSTPNTSWAWVLEGIINEPPFTVLEFELPSNANARSVEQVLNLQGCNIKLPANYNYRLRSTAAAGNITLQHYFAWSYSDAFG